MLNQFAFWFCSIQYCQLQDIYFFQLSDQEQRRLDRKERKQKRKLARVLKRAGIAEEQIGEMKTDGIAVSLNLTPEQVALLTSPRKRLYGVESEFFKVKQGPRESVKFVKFSNNSIIRFLWLLYRNPDSYLFSYRVHDMR